MVNLTKWFTRPGERFQHLLHPELLVVQRKPAPAKLAPERHKNRAMLRMVVRCILVAETQFLERR